MDPGYWLCFKNEKNGAISKKSRGKTIFIEDIMLTEFLHQNHVLVLHRRSRFSKQGGKQWGRQENSQQRKFSIFGRAAGNCVHDNDTVICSAKTKSQILQLFWLGCIESGFSWTETQWERDIKAPACCLPGCIGGSLQCEIVGESARLSNRAINQPDLRCNQSSGQLQSLSDCSIVQHLLLLKSLQKNPVFL